MCQDIMFPMTLTAGRGIQGIPGQSFAMDTCLEVTMGMVVALPAIDRRQIFRMRKIFYVRIGVTCDAIEVLMYGLIVSVFINIANLC